ncbi:hypothetical protein BKI52_11020 [marine bacterium AO1-C]|nr:hypothetical protein BKI52_11020 [marine bacterium AO1-C]
MKSSINDFELPKLFVTSMNSKLVLTYLFVLGVTCAAFSQPDPKKEFEILSKEHQYMVKQHSNYVKELASLRRMYNATNKDITNQKYQKAVKNYQQLIQNFKALVNKHKQLLKLHQSVTSQTKENPNQEKVREQLLAKHDEIRETHLTLTMQHRYYREDFLKLIGK